MTVAEGSSGANGSITISAPAGIASVTIAGSTINASALASVSTNPITIDTQDGVLTLTAFDGVSGTLSFTYIPHTVTNISGAAAIDNIAIAVLDASNAVATATLSIGITDSMPTAAADVASVTDGIELNGVSGNVFLNDSIGADTNSNPISLCECCTGTWHPGS